MISQVVQRACGAVLGFGSRSFPETGIPASPLCESSANGADPYTYEIYEGNLGCAWYDLPTPGVP